jgi:hypothetical protein
VEGEFPLSDSITWRLHRLGLSTARPQSLPKVNNQTFANKIQVPHQASVMKNATKSPKCDSIFNRASVANLL